MKYIILFPFALPAFVILALIAECLDCLHDENAPDFVTLAPPPLVEDVTETVKPGYLRSQINV